MQQAIQDTRDMSLRAKRFVLSLTYSRPSVNRIQQVVVFLREPKAVFATNFSLRGTIACALEDKRKLKRRCKRADKGELTFVNLVCRTLGMSKQK